MPKDKSFDNPAFMPKEIAGRFPTIRVIAMPKDANPSGDTFGGWLLSQMDLAGAAHAYKYVEQRIVTIGVEAMTFHEPVFIGDEVSIYTDIEKVGRTSIAIAIECWAFRRDGREYVKVTQGRFTYVTIDEERKPVEIELL